MVEKITSEVIESLRNSRLVFADLDETLIDKRVAESSFRLIKNERKLKHYSNVIRGYGSGLEVYLGTPLLKPLKGDMYAYNWGIKKLHDILKKSKIAKQTIYDIALSYVGDHEIGGAKRCFDTLKSFGKPKKFIIITGSASVFAEPAAKYFEADDFIANNTKYTAEGLIDGLEITMRTPQDRMKLVKNKAEENESKLEDSLVFTDNLSDRIFENHVRGLFWSPMSNQKTGFHISSYEAFKNQIESLH